ncbi:oncostatin-M [Cynocephalus volans]|uniref:oncostatin-M n=1 Tax=Cynocephalus volans TaxID=110931 RepID=UPI002FCC3283
MRAQLTRRTLLGLVLGLLIPSMAAMGNCSSYRVLLHQLQRQADLMQDTSTLLDYYIHIQGLDTPILRGHCKERPGAFPSEGTLRGLGKRGFLRTLSATLNRVLHRLAAFQRRSPKAQYSEKLQMARLYIQGLRNNIYCISQQLDDSSETAEPTQLGPGASPPSTPTPDTFESKLEDCRFLHGYHRFMRSVGRVFSEWEESRSQTHSPQQALSMGARRARLSSGDNRLMPRGQLPR